MHHKANFYGSATVGTKGQIVIPAKAREELRIATGDQLIFFGVNEGKMLCVCPVESVESLLEELSAKVKTIQKVVNSTKKGA